MARNEHGGSRWSKWLGPTLAVGIGIAYLIAFWAGGDPKSGVGGLALMSAVAVLLIVGGRSEVIRALRGQPSDERWRSFDLRATAFAGLVTIFAIIGGFLYEIARGHSGSPYAWLGALAGLSYLAAFFWLQRRS